MVSVRTGTVVGRGHERQGVDEMKKVATTKQNAECQWVVTVVATGETLATFDSGYLAKQMVSTINRNCAKA
jgi:hypothetical protein